MSPGDIFHQIERNRQRARKRRRELAARERLSSGFGDGVTHQQKPSQVDSERAAKRQATETQPDPPHPLSQIQDPIRRQRRYRQLAHYRTSYQQALRTNDTGIGIVQRLSLSPSTSCSNLLSSSELDNDSVPSDSSIPSIRQQGAVLLPSQVHHYSQQLPSPALMDRYTASIPFLLLLLPLHVAWDASLQSWPTYEHLLRHCRNMDMDRRHLMRELARVQQVLSELEARQQHSPRASPPTPSTMSSPADDPNFFPSPTTTKPLQDTPYHPHDPEQENVHNWSSAKESKYTSKKRQADAEAGSTTAPTPIRSNLRETTTRSPHREPLKELLQWDATIHDDDNDIPPTRPRRVTVSPAKIAPPISGKPPSEDSSATAVPDGIPSHPAATAKAVPSNDNDHIQSPSSITSSVHCQSPRIPSPGPLIEMPSRSDTISSYGDAEHEDDSQTVVPSLPIPTISTTRNAAPAQRQRQMTEFTDNPKSSKKTNVWISNRPARRFVAEITNKRSDAAVVDRVSQNFKKEITPGKSANGKAEQQPQPQPSHAVVAASVKQHSSESSHPTTTIITTNTEIPYCEVVRKKADRAALKPHECPECGKFIDAIMEQDKHGVYNRHELMCASRHRHRFTPPETPEDFWELSFIDERDARLKRQKEEAAKKRKNNQS